MSANFLILSKRDEDIRFANELTRSRRYLLHQASSPEEIRSVLMDHPRTVLFWDGDDAENTDRVMPVIRDLIPRHKAFVITDHPFNAYPRLCDFPVAHHIYRRFEHPAMDLYGKLAGSCIAPVPWGLDKYFDEDVMRSRIALKRSSHKAPAAEAVQNVLLRLSVNSRLAALVAQGTDELIMNALFDAPVLPDGTSYRRHLDRSADFALIEKEQVDLEIMYCDSYLGISVADRFGSLKRDTLVRFARKDYQREAYQVNDDSPGAGLGLYGILQAGVSMIFVSKPGERTEVSLIVPRTENFKDFRKGFRFLTIRSE